MTAQIDSVAARCLAKGYQSDVSGVFHQAIHPGTDLEKKVSLLPFWFNKDTFRSQTQNEFEGLPGGAGEKV